MNRPSENGYMTPDEEEAYARGYAKAQRNHERAESVSAFAAIRRAAKVARDHDRVSIAALARNDELICERHEENADAIRDAIRAAIESPKI